MYLKGYPNNGQQSNLFQLLQSREIDSPSEISFKSNAKI